MFFVILKKFNNQNKVKKYKKYYLLTKIQLYYEHIDIHVCNLCGCPLSKKIFSPLPGEEACPDKRWKK